MGTYYLYVIDCMSIDLAFRFGLSKKTKCITIDDKNNITQHNIYVRRY